MSTDDLPDKELIYKIYKELTQLNFKNWQFLGGLVVRFLAFTSTAQVQALVGQMRSYKLLAAKQQTHKSKYIYIYQFSSVQSQSCPTLWDHESQHARPTSPSQTPRVYSNSCPRSW